MPVAETSALLQVVGDAGSGATPAADVDAGGDGATYLPDLSDRAGFAADDLAPLPDPGAEDGIDALAAVSGGYR